MVAAVKTPRESNFHYQGFGPWAPDAPKLGHQGLTFLQNGLPRKTGTYGPARAGVTSDVNSMASFGTPVKAAGDIVSDRNSQPVFTLLSAGTHAVAAGGSQLFTYNDQSRTWADASQVGGYTLSATDAWRFARFDGDFVACGGINNPLQNLSPATFGGIYADLSATAPAAKDIATVDEFLVAINTDGGTAGGLPAGRQPRRVWWSAAGDHTNWPDAGTAAAANVRSGFTDLQGGGNLQRIIPGIGGARAIIFGENRVWRMNRAGPPDTWDFQIVEFGQGVYAPNTVAATNETIFYYGNGAFYQFDGSNSIPIGAGAVDSAFIGLNPAQNQNIEIQTTAEQGFQFAMAAAMDDINGLYILGYRTAASGDNFNNTALVYNIYTKTWGQADIPFDVIGRVDTKLTETDAPRIVIIDQDFQVKEPTGATLPMRMQPGELRGEGSQALVIKSMRPFVDADPVQGRLQSRNDFWSSEVQSDLLLPEETGTIPVRAGKSTVTAVQWRADLEVAGGVEWDSALGVEYEIGGFARGPRRST